MAVRAGDYRGMIITSWSRQRSSRSLDCPSLISLLLFTSFSCVYVLLLGTESLFYILYLVCFQVVSYPVLWFYIYEHFFGYGHIYVAVEWVSMMLCLCKFVMFSLMQAICISACMLQVVYSIFGSLCENGALQVNYLLVGRIFLCS